MSAGVIGLPIDSGRELAAGELWEVSIDAGPHVDPFLCIPPTTVGRWFMLRTVDLHGDVYRFGFENVSGEPRRCTAVLFVLSGTPEELRELQLGRLLDAISNSALARGGELAGDEVPP